MTARGHDCTNLGHPMAVMETANWVQEDRVAAAAKALVDYLTEKRRTSRDLLEDDGAFIFLVPLAVHLHD